MKRPLQRQMCKNCSVNTTDSDCRLCLEKSTSTSEFESIVKHKIIRLTVIAVTQMHIPKKRARKLAIHAMQQFRKQEKL